MVRSTRRSRHVMRRLALLAAVLLVSCGSLNEETQSGALAGGRDRHIVDADGGWSLEAPSSWFDRPSAQHGREIMNYDPTGMDNDGNTPPPGGIFLRLQMQQNPDRLGAASFLLARGQGSGSGVIEHSQLLIAGQPTEFYLLRQHLPAEFARLEETLYWFLKSPFFDDRMVVISAVPGDSPLRADVERIVGSLHFSQPALVSRLQNDRRFDALRACAVTSRARGRSYRSEARSLEGARGDEPVRPKRHRRSRQSGLGRCLPQQSISLRCKAAASEPD